jgi:hypothetical protein
MGGTDGLHRIRFWCGGANFSTPPYANEQPISGRGFGWEYYYSTDNAQYEIRLFAHNGTTFVTNDGLSGRPSPIVAPNGSQSRFINPIIGLNSSGTVSLWMDTTYAAGLPVRPSETPVLTLGGGPTSGNYGNSGAICFSAVAQSTGAAGTFTDIRAQMPTVLLGDF